MKDRILSLITNFYLESGDFNGISLSQLISELDEDSETVKDLLSLLIEDELIGIVFDDTDVNPHILRMGVEEASVQIEKLKQGERFACIYPRPKHLIKIVDQAIFSSEPYTLELGLGSAQLDYRSFDLSVLEFYRNDPRYRYDNDDVRGSISAIYDEDNPDAMPEKDQVLLNTFGFSYDDDMNRAVAVFVRYLSDLSPEHQQIWKAKELEGEYKLHPDYFRNSILGDWGEGISIFDAFLLELETINEMTVEMDYPALFLGEFSGDDKPREFTFLIRPTKKELSDFVHLLDKMLSENINRDFFSGDVEHEFEETRKDGKVVIRQKGTIRLLDEWLAKMFRPKEPEIVTEMMDAFKEVRKLRQKPAHRIEDNTFDQQHFHEQRRIIKLAYTGLRTLRLILANHPNCAGISPNPVLNGIIWEQ